MWVLSLKKCVIVTFIISKPAKYTVMILNLDPGDDLKSIKTASSNFYELLKTYTQSLGDTECYISKMYIRVCECV